MPIISIRSLPLRQQEAIGPEPVISSILTTLCNEVATAIGYDPKNIRATWEFIPPTQYVVGEQVGSVQAETTHSPVVRVLSFEGKTQEQVETMLKTVARVLSNELKIDMGNIFIEYAEARSGHVFDGGQIVYKNNKELQ